MGTLTSRLIVSLTDRVTGPARGISGALARLHRQGQRTSGALIGGGVGMMGGTVRNMLAIGAGYVGVSKAIGGTVGAAIKFEEAFADVRKVFNGTPAQLQEVRHQILSMSKAMPTTAAGLSAIFASAAQANIPTHEIGKFSEAVAKVAVAWDTSEGETSQALAEIKNQLGMNVDQIILYADAINHLGNNTAARAPDLVDFSKRVAATGEMFGFSSKDALAFGGAMIAMGAQTEVAATSFRNMGKALTRGAGTKKEALRGWRRVGLDPSTVAKEMQKDATKTTLRVIESIQKVAKHERTDIAFALFGEEARALMPVINNTTELRRQLSLLASDADYAGSAFQEYLVRADTTGNALKLIGNKIAAVGIGIGDSWLPTIKELGAGIGDVLDTLEKRVGVLDQVKFAFQGFMGGIGYGGSGDVRRMINDVGDLFFGKAFGGSLSDADDRMTGLARLSNRFRTIGADLKSFADNVSGGNISAAVGNVGDAIGKLGGGLTVGGALAIGVAGRGMMALSAGAVALALSPIGRIALAATAVSSLIEAAKDAGSIGEFVKNLSALSALDLTVIGAGLGFVGLKIWSIVAGLRAWRLVKNGVSAPINASAKESVTGRKPTGPKISDGGVKSSTPDWINKGRSSNAATLAEESKALFSPGSTARWVSGAVKGVVAAVITNIGEGLINDGFRAAGINPDTSTIKSDLEANKQEGLSFWEFQKKRREERPDNESSFVGSMKWIWDQLPASLTKPIGDASGPADVNLIGIPEVTIPAPVTTQPSGTQDVRVTNPQPAPHITVHVTATQDPQAIAAAAVAAISAKWSALSRGAFSDGAN